MTVHAKTLRVSKRAKLVSPKADVRYLLHQNRQNLQFSSTSHFQEIHFPSDRTENVFLTWNTVTVAQSMLLKCFRSHSHLSSLVMIISHVQLLVTPFWSVYLQNLPPNRYIPRMLSKSKCCQTGLLFCVEIGGAIYAVDERGFSIFALSDVYFSKIYVK